MKIVICTESVKDFVSCAETDEVEDRVCDAEIYGDYGR
jgi:hypothetical protein